MALTGIEIFKLLPKTNCGECGVPTCLAFAMSLAAGKAELSACPYVLDEAKEKLEEASAPPIRPVTIGVGEGAIKVGGETVLFRHEKRFENPPGLAILISHHNNHFNLILAWLKQEIRVKRNVQTIAGHVNVLTVYINRIDSVFTVGSAAHIYSVIIDINFRSV